MKLRNHPVFNSLIFIFIVFMTGCGLKGNPVPYAVLADNKPVVRNLEIVQTENSTILKWNFQDKDRLIKYIGIERSEVGTPGNECKDCPRTFEKISQIMIAETTPADKEQNVFNYIDKKVVKGKIYTYRLMLCEDNGNCSEGATVEINYK
jgi:hypothetical protein